MSLYAAAHANPQGIGDARPTALQIVQDNDMEGKLVGKTAVVTGVSSGVGIEIVRALAATRATLILTARDLEKAQSALGDVYNPDTMHLVLMDQSLLPSVHTAAKEIIAKADNKISLLIGNAGIMALQERTLTEDSYEAQFATNHLSHFLLFHLLKPALLAGSTPDFHSRVVLLSGSVHRIKGLNDADNYHFEKGGYDPWTAYAQSKTANTYMANELERRYGSRGLHATSAHPGNIPTGLVRHLPEDQIEAMKNPAYLPILKSPAQGAATPLVAAVGKEWEGRGGKYLANCVEAPVGEDDGDIFSPKTSSVTYNPKDEARLWADSLKMVGLPDDED